jgi:hypothetical protein
MITALIACGLSMAVLIMLNLYTIYKWYQAINGWRVALSLLKTYDTILKTIKATLENQQLRVLPGDEWKQG